MLYFLVFFILYIKAKSRGILETLKSIGTLKRLFPQREQSLSASVNQKAFSPIFFRQVTAVNVKSAYLFPAVDVSCTGAALFAGSPTARR